MQKLDFKKQDKVLYTGKVGRFDRLDIPAMPFLMIDGHGDPNTLVYGRAIAALYGLSYALKFHSKRTLERDYVVPPLEGLWWAQDMTSFTARNKDQWDWTMMIRQPGWITSDMLELLRPVSIAKNAKKKEPPTQSDDFNAVRLETFTEGDCVQILHVGSYDDEGPILSTMHHDFIPQNNLTMIGKHHEIYLSDPRKIAASKLKTILRQPVANNSP